MSTSSANLKEIFIEALRLTDPAERAAFLASACKDPAMIQRIEALLRASEDSASFLDKDVGVPIEGVAPSTGSFHRAESPILTENYVSDENPDEIIAGRYKLLEEIGQGGMGTVWMAEQIEPVKRKVALKLIKAGMDSRNVLARFEAERQALAIMDHPNIARVLDGGLTALGRPFFVMEYVKGIPITEYCDSTRLSISDRLNLFVQVCSAVQHAHQKGIIHRDLKPSNILVAPFDDRPVIKVIDFGLAKAMHQPLTEKTLHTAHDTVMGTPLYMSPEQAQLNNLDVDTRSDIYSLGVLLYELLTGTTPLERQRFRKAAWDEVKRIIREEEPPRPSDRLSSTATLPSLAASRQSEPRKLTRQVRGELDWIVMKALEKDRTRRYETANGFAADINRFLAGEPVLAHPPSGSYRIRKFIRRNRLAVGVVSLVLFTLFFGIAGTTFGLVRAERQRENAEKAAENAEKAAESEREAKLSAERMAEQEKMAKEQAQHDRDAKEQQRKYAQAITDFVRNDFLALTSIEGQDRFGGKGKESLNRETSLMQLLDRAADKLDKRQDLDPLAEAEIRWMIGVNYRGVEKLDRAIAFLQKSLTIREQILGSDDTLTLNAANSLALAYEKSGKPTQAIELLEKISDPSAKKLGAEDPLTLTILDNLGSAYSNAGKFQQAIKLLEKVRESRERILGSDHFDTLTTLNNLAHAFQDAGLAPKAIELRERVRDRLIKKVGPEHPHTLSAISNLAAGYTFVGRLKEAIEILEKTRDIQIRKLGADDSDTLTTLNNLAIAYGLVGRSRDGVELLEQVRDAQIRKLGPDHLRTLKATCNLANSYRQMGKLPQAIKMLEQVREAQIKILGADHPDTLHTGYTLAIANRLFGNLPQAIKLLEQVRDEQLQTLGTDHPDTLRTLSTLGETYHNIGKLPQAIELLEKARDIQIKKLGAEHHDTLITLNGLAATYLSAKMLPQAIELFEQVIEAQTRIYGPDQFDTLTMQNNLAMAYTSVGKLPQAIVLFEKVLKAQIAKGGTDHPATILTLNNLGTTYLSAGNAAQALLLIEQAASGIEKLNYKHEYVGRIIPNLINISESEKQFEKAEVWRRKWLVVVKQQSGDRSAAYAAEVANLGGNLLSQRKYSDAETVLRECLLIGEILIEKKKAFVWQVANVRSTLGEALLGQMKLVEAEQLLISSYEDLKQNEMAIPAVARRDLMSKAIQRMIDLAAKSNKPDDVKKWQAEAAKYPPIAPMPREAKH